jgi:predicted TIM-barrel fold metal-dependent hydrolase
MNSIFPPTSRVDAHVHVVGNGKNGSGCWLKLKGKHAILARFMVAQLGLEQSSLTGDLETVYVARLLELLQESSLQKAIILAHDQVYHSSGLLMEGAGSFYVPNDYVLTLARKHPEFMPAISIHPARADAIPELERCADLGAVMMKCLPNCHNIDCNDRKYVKFWEKMAELKLPLLAHTGGENTVPVVNPAYSNPRVLTLPLRCGVNVIAAHCGTRSGFKDPDYFDVFASMISEFPNLYGDNSAFNLPMRCKPVPQCLKEPIVSRIIHGSDFPVPVSGRWAWMRGLISREDFTKSKAIGNVIERDVYLKKAMGFGEETFTRIHQLLPKQKQK